MNKIATWFHSQRQLGHESYGSLVTFGAQKDHIMDKICAGLLALSPILQHYKGPHDAGVLVLILVFPWLALRFCQAIREFKLSSQIMVAGLILFAAYRSVVHEFYFLYFAQNMVFIAYLVLAAAGMVNIAFLLKTAGLVSLMASILVVIQYFCYYVLGFHLQLVSTTLLLPSCEQWFLGVQTGLAGINGKIGTLYRPSAFFLEPSHMFLYVFPHVFLMLFSREITHWKLTMGVIFSLGILLTTSGMGILTLGLAWLVFIALWDGMGQELKLSNLKKKKNLIRLGIFLGVSILLLVCVPFLRATVMRFLDPSKKGAIAGRSRLAWDLIGKMEGGQLAFGVTSTLEGIEFNMPGFNATLYKFGIVGILLSYTAYVYGLVRLKGAYSFISLMIILISFSSAHTHGTFYMLYFVFILLAGRGCACRQTPPCRLFRKREKQAP